MNKYNITFTLFKILNSCLFYLIINKFAPIIDNPVKDI